LSWLREAVSWRSERADRTALRAVGDETNFNHYFYRYTPPRRPKKSWPASAASSVTSCGCWARSPEAPSSENRPPLGLEAARMNAPVPGTSSG
jgi:hypothetical protein